MLRNLFVGFLSILTLLWIAAPSAYAQKDAGSIVGTVTDASGAVVVAARVTVTSVDQGTQLVVATNGEGYYVASPLKIGQYQVTVEKAGFKKAVAGPITVNVQSRVSTDFALQVGQADEVVNVKSTAPLLETETSDLGQVIDQQRIETLPLNGRNYAQLALLGAGVAPSGGDVASSEGDRPRSMSTAATVMTVRAEGASSRTCSRLERWKNRERSSPPPVRATASPTTAVSVPAMSRIDDATKST